jgi:hypothetical protein
MTLTILQNQGAVGQGAVGPVEQEKPVLLSSLFHQIISIERLGLHHGSGSHRVRAGGQLFAAKSEAEALGAMVQHFAKGGAVVTFQFL